MFETNHCTVPLLLGLVWRAKDVRILAALAWAVCTGLAQAQVSQQAGPPVHDCRIAFDMGSSGVRAAGSGMAEGTATASRDLDLLTPLMQGQRLAPLLPAVERALRELPQQAQLPAACRRVGGGFSAWRLAWHLEGEQLARQLETLHVRTGVAVLVIPAAVEGRYGYDSAQQALGLQLQTSHILDIGGGSMQVASQDRSYGLELGQKSWLRKLCQVLGRDTDNGNGTACPLLPLALTELQQARDLVNQQLQALPSEVGTGTLTAISRPVTRGVHTALHSLGLTKGETLLQRELSLAIERLSVRSLVDVVQLTGQPLNFAPYLVSDMLLVEAVMRAMKLPSLVLAETAINNLPALLRDERAFEWAQHYPCYVKRLRELGPSAYFSNPGDCAKP